MSDELEEIVNNIREGASWKRILFMIAFSIATYLIIVPLIFVLSIAQALFTLITGKGNANLRYFAATLSLFVTQLVEFLTYLSEVKPYPFSDLPEVEDGSLHDEPAVTSANKKENGAAKDEAKASAKSTAGKKPAVKKAAVKKQAAKKKAAKKEKAPKAAEKPEADAGNEGASNS